MLMSIYDLLSWFDLIMMIGSVLCDVRAEGENTFFVLVAVSVLFDLRADFEQTVEYRTWWILNVEYRYCEVLVVNFSPCDVSMLL
jgi:hypothetical protein